LRSYLALIKIDLKLALRNKSVLFFNYLFPLIFFFTFAQFLGDGLGGRISYIVSMVLVLGILGNGLFGAGMRAVQEREANILRRFKVAPISPIPILIASMVTGWVLYMPSVLLVLGLAHYLYGMAMPERWAALFALISVGVVAFRAVGLILAAVANSVQESNILIQTLYMPMLFLSGATFPMTMLPAWAQVTAQYLPATYLVTGFQGVFYRRESLIENWPAVLALLATICLATFVSAQLFRWEKEERIAGSAKLWVLGVLLPFFVLGSYEMWTRDNIRKAEGLWRDLERKELLLIRDARIFVGDGHVIESGTVLIEAGKIRGVFESNAPDPNQWQGDVIDAAGKTLLPGLIDVHIHLAAPGGAHPSDANYDFERAMERALAAYLYSGVTAVRSVGDPLPATLRLRRRERSGELQGAELFVCGPMFTSEGGHGTQYFETLPEGLRAMAVQQWLRTPATGEEAVEQVRELEAAGVDGIKAVMDSGRAGMLFNRMDTSILEAIGGEARARELPLTVHTGDSLDILSALDAEATGVEHGSARDAIPVATLARMAELDVAYDPTLSVLEALVHLSARDQRSLQRFLVQQVGPLELLEQTRKALDSGKMAERLADRGFEDGLERARRNLLRAHRAGVTLVTGTDSGNPLVFHGPAIHRELQLWVEAGIPPAVALQAATRNAASLLGAGDRLGLIQTGYEANLLLVDGDPLEDITSTERISLVIYKGGRVQRSRLFD
jgi:imidazolonepropionase-like amidohydrolase/ABC-type multidrug transport system permease subunit